LSKKPFKAVFDFYLYSNLHVALCGLALIGFTQLIFNFELRAELYVFVFCGTFFLYSLQRLPSAFQQKKIESEFSRHKWNLDHKYFLAITSLITAIASCWSFFRLYQRSQIISLLPAMLSFAYAFPVLPLNGKWKRLREIPVLKIFIVAIVWGMISVLLPATAASQAGTHWLTPPIMIWFAIFCVMIFAHTIPFDIRDLYYDGEKLKTIPALVGIKKSILISLFSFLVFDAGVFFLHYQYGVATIYQVIAIIMWSILAGIAIARSTPERKEYYFSFTLDGLLILLWAMVKLAGLFGN
jgi:4-hydroxybenzoate polyprenyltransferase